MTKRKKQLIAAMVAGIVVVVVAVGIAAAALGVIGTVALTNEEADGGQWDYAADMTVASSSYNHPDAWHRAVANGEKSECMAPGQAAHITVDGRGWWQDELGYEFCTRNDG